MTLREQIEKYVPFNEEEASIKKYNQDIKKD